MGVPAGLPVGCLRSSPGRVDQSGSAVPPQLARTMAFKTSHDWVCTTCRIGIAGRPTFHVGLAFCCAGCVADGPCICSYDDPADAPASTDPLSTILEMRLPILTR